MTPRLTLVTAPVAEPVTLAEAKSHLRVEHSDDDQYIDALITVAREWAESFTRRAFITQTWDLVLDHFPHVITVPLPPLQSVTAASFTHVDTAGTTTQVTSTVYTVDTDSEPGRVYEAYGQSWPSTRDIQNAVRCRFVAGYGDAATDVPAPIRHAIKILVSQWYEHREPVVINMTPATVPMTVHALLYPYQVPVGF